MNNKTKLYLRIFAATIGIPTWIYLFITDWKMGLIIFLIMFSNNIEQHLRFN